MCANVASSNLGDQLQHSKKSAKLAIRSNNLWYHRKYIIRFPAVTVYARVEASFKPNTMPLIKKFVIDVWLI